jgi:hypothetical protein
MCRGPVENFDREFSVGGGAAMDRLDQFGDTSIGVSDLV